MYVCMYVCVFVCKILVYRYPVQYPQILVFIQTYFNLLEITIEKLSVLYLFLILRVNALLTINH